MTSMTLFFEKRALKVTTSFDPDASCVQGDRDRLVQVVTNLLSNAVGARYHPCDNEAGAGTGSA